MADKRPKIKNLVRVRLWVLAGGRCQFLGCNRELLNDELTLTEGNYANISHIVSWTPTGPRGDVILSPILATDISNLMLTCKDHGKLIDDPENVPTYPREKLEGFKKLHEGRIRIQTDIQERHKTTVVRLQANLRQRTVEVPREEVYLALIDEGMYPADEKGVFIDLTAIAYSSDKSFWEVAAKKVVEDLRLGLQMGNDETKPRHLSVFAVAPIPLLAHLGYHIGNALPADVFVKPRQRNWLYRGDKSGPAVTFNLKSSNEEKSSDIALVLAVSGSTTSAEVYRAVGRQVPIYELAVAQPGIDVIMSSTDLEEFRKGYRAALDAIRERHGKEARVHLIGAIPTCAAVVCGREILHGVDPTIVVYEHGDQAAGLYKVLTLNEPKQ